MSLIKQFSNGLIERDGIFHSKTTNEISYPEDGNQKCYQIEDDSFWFNHRNNCIIKAVKNYSPNDVFFDIGGGNGFVAHGLEKAGIKSILVEPGIAGCLNAKKRGLTNVVCSTLESADFIENTLPCIGFFDVVEHINDDLMFLKTANRFLKKDGLLFITVPAFNFLWSTDDTIAGHYRRYTTRKITSVLREADFDIVYSTFIFSILPLPIFLFRTIPSKFKKPSARELNNNASIKSNKTSNEHSRKKGIVTKITDYIWNAEVGRIENKKTIPFGGSILIVAKKR